MGAVACARCGKLDATVRLATVTFVVSAILLSFRRGGRQILCRRCRRLRAAEYSAVSLVAGWWGIPWGLIWTPISVIGNVRTALDSGLDRRANAALLALASTQLRAAGRSLEADEAHNAALALDADIANATIAAPEPIAAAVAPSPAPPIPLRQRLRRPRTLREWLTWGIVGVFVVGVGFTGGRMYWARAFPRAISAPTAPIGGTVVSTRDFAIALPGGWESIAMDPAQIDASLAAFRAKQPSLTIDEWARAQLKNKAALAAVYVGPEAAQFRYVPLVTLMLDDTDLTDLTRYAERVARALASDAVVKKPIDRRKIQLPGGPAENFHYTIDGQGGTVDVMRIVLYDNERAYGYQLRFESLATQASAMQKYVAAIASSLRTPQSVR